MTAKRKISGIHHITAVTSSAAENLAFYENVLGLRLVKQTVNFDDPYTYHLYYGDAQGSPGTILTFFPWENVPPGKVGSGMVTAIGFAIPIQSIDFWIHRIIAQGIQVDTDERFGDPVIRLADPHGLPIELIGTTDRPSSAYWQNSPIAKVHAITGFHSATATLNSAEDSKVLLQNMMGMILFDESHNRYRFMMDSTADPGHFYDVVVDPQAPLGRPGSGTVHHIAFRTENDAAQAEWKTTLRASGINVTDVRDRKYFRSIYFHMPEGILFEIATDPPGFTVDESLDKLGVSLKLPDQYEPIRADIEKHLSPLRSRPYRHVFKQPKEPENDGQTLVTLHGTGGNEYDLLGLAENVSPTSAVLSPRGNVLENGMPRFFKRVANNIFDEMDVIQRTHEISDFITSTTDKYNRNPDRIIALGYSNGANIAAAILLLRPEVISGAILLRPMLPLQNPELPDLHGKNILILKGKHDTIIPSESTDRLIEFLLKAGADVTIIEINAGHEITARDVEAISRWLAKPTAFKQKATSESLIEETV
jgi:predicted esterase/catechol 2,3-dioxygenase-like lactoylglutathione lyase family enzyme